VNAHDAGQDVNRETEKAHGTPVLNAETFQRLLAAAYVLQLHHDRRPSVQPIGAAHTSSFAAGAIVQRRIPSVTIRETQVQADQHGAVPFGSANNFDKLPGRTDQTWKAAEAITIAIVFCIMTGASIHRLSAFSGRISLPSGMLEQRNASQPAVPTAKVLASSQHPVVTRNSRQSPDGGEGDNVAEDIVIHYRKQAVNLPGQLAKKPASSPVQAQLLPSMNTTSKPGSRSMFGRNADLLAADTVVQYGDDVKMWSRNPKKVGLERLGH
jgi:hypothetical protein